MRVKTYVQRERAPRIRCLLLVLENHPVQYRAPLYREIENDLPGGMFVMYATGGSALGAYDSGFDRTVRWDTPLLDGYNCAVLRAGRARGIDDRMNLCDLGVATALARLRPSVVLLTGLHNLYYLCAYFSARLLGIPIWLRVETQDEAFQRRGPLKRAIRKMAYSCLYTGVVRGFYIGELNRQHLFRHGVPSRRLTLSPYATVDRISGRPKQELDERRRTKRSEIGVAPDRLVVAFFGKLIPKKDPLLLIKAVTALPEALRRKVHLLVVGSGRMRGELEREVGRGGIDATFAGFVNQAELPDWYLAADVVALPSRRQGETWGLVVNEAFQAGCAVAVSDAVGCAGEFLAFRRFRRFPAGSVEGLAAAIADLSRFPRSFNWAREPLRRFSMEMAAAPIISALSAHADRSLAELRSAI